MLAAYRDDGSWIQLLQACSWHLKNDYLECFPPRGFIGLGSTSSAGIGPLPCKLNSIQLRRVANTRGAPLWRLTLEWETLPLPSLLNSGLSSGKSGRD